MSTLLLSLILTVSFVLRVADGQGEVTERVCVSYITIVFSFEAALGFVLNGVKYPNGSTVLRTDIGEGEAVGTQTRSRSNRKYKKQEGARRQAIAYSVKVEILKINLNPDRTTCMYSHIVYLYLWLAYRVTDTLYLNVCIYSA